MELESELRIDDAGEICKATFSKGYEIFDHLCSIGLLILAVVEALTTNLATAIIIFLICGSGVLFIEISLAAKKKRSIKLTKERWQEVHSGKNIIYHYDFKEDVISISNLTNQGKAEISYDVFRKYVETEHYALLMTKTKQYLVFNKDVAREHDIKGFVKQKNEKLKG